MPGGRNTYRSLKATGICDEGPQCGLGSVGVPLHRVVLDSPDIKTYDLQCTALVVGVIVCKFRVYLKKNHRHWCGSTQLLGT